MAPARTRSGSGTGMNGFAQASATSTSTASAALRVTPSSRARKLSRAEAIDVDRLADSVDRRVLVEPVGIGALERLELAEPGEVVRADRVEARARRLHVCDV